MYEYPTATNIEGILSFPTQSNPYFWLWVFAGIFLIFTFASYFKEVKIFGRGKLLSSLVVSSFFITILATIGSLVGFVTSEILILIVVFFSIFTAIFFFSSKD